MMVCLLSVPSMRRRLCWEMLMDKFVMDLDVAIFVSPSRNKLIIPPDEIAQYLPFISSSSQN